MKETDFQPTDPAPRLWWVCSASGWAVGRALQPQPWIEAQWPDGQLPPDFPEDDWSQPLSRALEGMAHATVVVDVWCFQMANHDRPLWWPDQRRNRRVWQRWLEDAGCVLGDRRRVIGEPAGPDTWAAVLRAESRRVPLALAVLRHVHTPGRQLLLSSVAALLVHLGLVGVVQPVLQAQRAQAQAQARSEQEAAQQQQRQERALALQQEQEKHQREWLKRQHLELAPLTLLERLLQDAQNMTQPQYWGELRHADGAWTVFGVTSHESAWHDASSQALIAWNPQTSESGAITLTALGAPPHPAWKYQARLTSAASETGAP
jgi:hypothetical protein